MNHKSQAAPLRIREHPVDRLAGGLPSISARRVEPSRVGQELMILLPATAGALWLAGQWRDGLIAWCIYAVALAMTLIAASSFVATNVGDSRLERSDVTEQRGRLDARLADLTARRAAITERRSVGQIDAALQAAQQDPSVLTVWRRTGGCVDVTLTASGSACHAVVELRQSKAAAELHDKLDALADFVHEPHQAGPTPRAGRSRQRYSVTNNRLRCSAVSSNCATAAASAAC